jgi:hypothetical protein
VIGLSDGQSPVNFISDLNFNPQITNLRLMTAILGHCVKVYTMQWNFVDYESMSKKLENRWTETLFWIQTEVLLVYRDGGYSVFALDDPLAWTLSLISKY